MTAHRTPADAGIAGDGWQAGFLHALRASGNVSAAARAAGTCRSRCYEARRRDPGVAAAWADALEEAAKLQNEALALALELERERLAAQAGLVAAEAGGASWLQRNWRPITMLSFLGLVVADAFGLLAFRLADQAWLLLQIGLGGYVVGRSVEKISPQITAISNAAPPRQRHGPQAKSRSKSRPASGHAKSG